MNRAPSSGERNDEETRPSWGTWSVRRAVVWSLVGSLLVVVLAGFATGLLTIPHAPLGEHEGGDIGGGDIASDDTGVVEDTSTDGPAAWTEYDAIVVFRNDDIQPYYRSETMRAVDDVFVEEGVPVTLGVIPRVDEDHAITDTDVCPYLREQSRRHPETFEFSLHGYTHEKRTTFHGGSEFGGLDPAQQRRYIEEGTRILTACVGERPTTFVPPMDTYDAATVDALRTANYTTVSGAGWFTAEYYDETTVFERGGLVHVPNDGGFVANWTTGEFHDSATLEQRFDWAVEDEGIYVQMLHYQDFDTPERLERLRAFVEYVKAAGNVRFMTVGELGDHVERGTVRRTDGGWKVYE